jgi:hypothetical protein
VSPSDDPELFQQIRLLLPKYLTPTESQDLFEELRKFPDKASFYFEREDLRDELLQGDGCRGFVAIDFLTGSRKTVSGVILSNSCDIDSKNATAFPVKILFAPIISLGRYVERLRAEGKKDEQIQGLLATIRKQRITNIFYLPACPGVTEESFILLDDIHAHPLSDFRVRDRLVLFRLRLNQFYFYFFLLSFQSTSAGLRKGYIVLLVSPRHAWAGVKSRIGVRLS